MCCPGSCAETKPAQFDKRSRTHSKGVYLFSFPLQYFWFQSCVHHSTMATLPVLSSLAMVRPSWPSLILTANLWRHFHLTRARYVSTVTLTLYPFHLAIGALVHVPLEERRHATAVLVWSHTVSFHDDSLVKWFYTTTYVYTEVFGMVQS